MRTNAEITIVRPMGDRPPTIAHIGPVMWQGVQTYAMVDKTAVVVSDTSVFIGKDIVDGLGGFKPNKGDFVVKGTKSYGETGRALRYMLEADGAITVVGVEDLTDCGLSIAHMEVRCK